MKSSNSSREAMREEFLQIMVDCIHGQYKDWSQEALIYECWNRLDDVLGRNKSK